MRSHLTLVGLSTRACRLALAGLLPFLLLGACRDRETPEPIAPEATEGAEAGPGGRPLGQPDLGPGTHFRLSNAEAGAPEGAADVPSASAAPLDPEALAGLVERLPELPATAAQAVDAQLPPGPPRPAIAGETIEVVFPPAEDAAPPPAESSGPLAVERVQPEGDVPIASHLAVTFSRPFAPLAANAELDAADVPVSIEPETAGRWRWVGTRTLLFEPELRFPMATRYTAEVPAGATAADGTALETGRSWTFTTPPPSVTTFWSNVYAPDRRALSILGFDQAVDPSAVLPFIAAAADDDDIPLRLASEDEVDADEDAARVVAGLIEGRWLALATEPGLPAGATVDLTVGPGVPSAEGPLTTESEQPYTFEVYGPLEAERLRCDDFYGGGNSGQPISGGQGRITDCDPFAMWSIEFTNVLDADAPVSELVSVEPAVDGLRIEAGGPMLTFQGLFSGRTRYTVRVAPGLMDEYGQSLEDAVELTIETGDARPALVVPGDRSIVLDPAGPRALSISVLNNPELDVQLYRVTPADWPAYERWYDELDVWTYEGWAAGEPLPRPFDREPDAVYDLSVESEPDTFGRVLVDLRPVLEGDFGHVVAIVLPPATGADDDNFLNVPRARWVQVTDLGLDFLRDGEQSVAFVTELADGRPVSGARVSDSAGLADPGTTGDDGVAIMGALVDDGDEAFDPAAGTYVLVERGADSTLLPQRFWPVGSSGESLRWFAFEDRGIYQPGETVAVKGYVRRFGLGVGGDVVALGLGGPASGEGEGEGDGESEGEAAAVPGVWTLRGWDGNEIMSGSLEIGAHGAFALQIELPEDAPVGHAMLELRAPESGLPGGADEGYTLDVNIAEFRRPEFEVAVEAEVPEIIVGERGSVSVQATYFAGGALPGAEVQWWVRPEASDWRPAGWDDFVFGRWQPWWSYWEPPSDVDTSGHELTSRTDDDGRHRLAIDLTAIEPPSAMSLLAQATVYDVNRQASSASAAVIAHPAALYVGIRTADRVVEPGRPATIEAIVTDLEGGAVAERIVAVQAERIEYREIDGEWREAPEVVDTCEIVSAAEPVACDLGLGDGGQYRVRATIADDAGRRNASELTIWMPGRPAQPRGSQVEEEQVELVPDQDDYAVGDTARILVRAPFAPAEALVTLRRSGLVETRRVTLADGSGTVEVEIEEGHVPNLYLEVLAVGSAPRDLDDAPPGGQGDGAGADEDAAEPSEIAVAPRPAFARGSLELRVPPVVRRLDVEVSPESVDLRPGQETSVTLAVTDAAGEPLADAEVALFVVDEAVLALTDYRIPDPIDAFYTARGPDVDENRSRRLVQLASIADLVAQSAGVDVISAASDMAEGATEDGVAMRAESLGLDEAERSAIASAMQPAFGRGGGGGDGDVATVAERIDLNPLAAFVPSLVTDEAGGASATFTLPDNVTRYRITAIATDGGGRFGTGEVDVTASLPLTARPSAPRFLNFGDAFELPVVVQNLSGEDREVDVVVRAANLSLRDADPPAEEGGLPVAAGRVRVPDGDRVEIRFPAVAQMPGTAVFQAAVFAVDEPALADAQRVSLPVYTPATTEAFATYGHVDEGAASQPVLRPQAIVPGFGGLEITASSTALAELTDAFLYLESYPFECSEQVASRLIAIVSMRDLLAAFGVPGLQSEAEIDAAVAAAVDTLWSMQREDGGFGWWRGGWEPGHPWVSLHVAHALVRARDRGVPLDTGRLDRALGYVADIRAHLDNEPNWPESTKRAAEAYALSILRLAGGGAPDGARSARAVELLGEAEDEESVETLGWLLQVLAGDADPAAAEAAAEIARRIGNRVTETASAATIATEYSEREGALILSGERRASAIVLDAWMSHAPDSDLVSKLVRGLLDGRVRGRWSTTQENAFSLVALERYFRTYEADEPDFTARAWVDETFAGETSFQGRSADRVELNVPFDALPESGPADLLLSKEGPGRLYYRLGLRYAPDDLSLAPDERGFAVLREYEAVDDPADVRRTADGGWSIRAGARVRVRLRMDAPADRYHVALVDPLPAGFEALNPALSTTEVLPEPEADADSAASARMWWDWRWYEHEAFRDHQVEIFAGFLPAGIHRYDYVARATTPGTFVVPPAKAEEMYHPETFGRSGTERVVIE